MKPTDICHIFCFCRLLWGFSCQFVKNQISCLERQYVSWRRVREKDIVRTHMSSGFYVAFSLSESIVSDNMRTDSWDNQINRYLILTPRQPWRLYQGDNDKRTQWYQLMCTIKFITGVQHTHVPSDSLAFMAFLYCNTCAAGSNVVSNNL